MNQIITEIKDTELFKEFENWYLENIRVFGLLDINTNGLSSCLQFGEFCYLPFPYQKGVFEEFLVQKGYWVQWSKATIHEDGELAEMSFINENTNCAYANDFEFTFEEHLIRTFKECNTH